MSMDQKMKGWDAVGAVDTMHEEEDQEHREIPSKSALLGFSPRLFLWCKVEIWSLVRECQTDVTIRFQDQLYHLHKQPLISKSRYFREHLSDSSEITVTLPPKITADTFIGVILFCYNSLADLNPWNLTAVRMAAEQLQMDIDYCDYRHHRNLMDLTEDYFREKVTGDAVQVKQVLSSSIEMLPDTTAALMVFWCLVALENEAIDDQWMQELVALDVAQFHVVADTICTCVPHDHGPLYMIVEYYLQNYKGSISEESKNSICQKIDPSKLSHDQLLHLVQNRQMPLRCILQASLMKDLLLPNQNSDINVAANNNAAEDESAYLSIESTPTIMLDEINRDIEMERAPRKSEISIFAKLMNAMKHLFKSTRKKVNHGV